MQFSIAGILGIAISCFIAFLIWRLVAVSKIKDITIGEAINEFFITEGELLLIIFLVCCYMAESMIATSLHPANEQIIDVFSRFLSHISISFFGFLASTLATKTVVEFFMSLKYFSTDKDANGKVIRESNFALPIILGTLSTLWLLAAIVVPYYNTNIIAVGLGKSHEFEYAFNQIICFWKDSNQVAREYGYDPHLSEFGIMGYNMTASFVVLFVHLAGSMIEGAYAALNGLVMGKAGYIQKYEDNKKKKRAKDKAEKAESGETEKPAPAKADKAEAKAETKAEEMNKTLSLYKNILGIFPEASDTGWLEATVTKMQKAYNTLDLADSGSLAQSLKDYQTAILRTKKKRTSADPDDQISEKQYNDIMKETRDDIAIFLNKPVSDGGFGLEVQFGG
jgi:hypothetical protein